MLAVKGEKILKAGIYVDTNFMLNCWAFSFSMMRRRPFPFLYAHILSLPFSPSLVVAFDTVVTQDSFLLQIHVVFCQPVACVINRERERERLFLVQFERMHLRERVKNEGHKTDRQNCLWFFLSLFSLSLSAYLYQRHSLFLFIIQALNGFLIFGIKTISTTTLGATTFGATTFSTTTLGTMTFSITTLGTMTLGTMTISITTFSNNDTQYIGNEDITESVYSLSIY